MHLIYYVWSHWLLFFWKVVIMFYWQSVVKGVLMYSVLAGNRIDEIFGQLANVN